LCRTIKNCESIARDTQIDAKVRPDAERLKIDCGILIIRLLREGPSILNFDRLVQSEEDRFHKWRSQDADYGVSSN
jgi:hypothetical protein